MSEIFKSGDHFSDYRFIQNCIQGLKVLRNFDRNNMQEYLWDGHPDVSLTRCGGYLQPYQTPMMEIQSLTES